MTRQATQVTNLSRKYKTLLDQNGINTARRLACFFGQAWVESEAKPRRENLNYSVQGLIKTFNRNRISVEDAQRLGRTSTRPANQTAIANILYGGEWGRRNLGNTQPNDGSRFIGRGIFQITGRANYEKLSKDTGIDFVNNPDLLLQEANSIIAAIWYWRQRKLNSLADRLDVTSISKIVNLGNAQTTATPKHLKERTDFTNEFLQIFS